MIKTIKLHVNLNEIFQKKETKQEIFSSTAESVIKIKSCNFSTSSQHIDDTNVGNDNKVSRDEIHFINKNCGRGNCYDEMGNEENQENEEISYVFFFF